MIVLPRNAATEDAELVEMARGFLAMQTRTAVEENRALCRSVHAKGVCAEAVFEVLDVAKGREPVLAERLAKGIFAHPRRYPSTVRFSNSHSNLNGDSRPDMRGLAFCADFTPSGSSARITRQDFSLQSAPTLPFNDIRALVLFARVFEAPNQAIALNSLPFSDQLIFARTMVGVMEQTRQPVRPYQRLRYWSAAPFRHGPVDVVKYSACPAAADSARPLETRNPNALRDELIRHLNEDPTMSSFDFGLQFLDVERMTYQGRRRNAEFWIENAAVEWPETQAPFHTVARLTLLPRSQLRSEACEAMYIDVSQHSTPDSAPIGGVNRARSYAVAASRIARLGNPGQVGGSCMRGGT